MRFIVATATLLVITALGAAHVGGAGAVVAAAQTRQSQWDGVYSAEQAKRGERLYVEHCSACHGDDLSGGDTAPALTGGDFNATWDQLTLGDVFERIRVSMPQDNPDALSRAQKTDVLAYMLYKGNYPAGEAALPTPTEALKMINFRAAKPGANLVD